MSQGLFTAGAIGMVLLVSLARSQQKPAPDTDAQRIEDLVTASHICANEGVVDSFGHLSVRSAKTPNRFYMPRALAPASVMAADVMEFDLGGNPVDPRGRRVNGERFIHSEIYKARQDVQAVVHSHSAVVMPFGIAGVPLKPVIAQAGFLPLETPLFEIREAWGLIKGPNELLQGRDRSRMLGLRQTSFGFEVLTDDIPAARREFGPRAVIDRASIEDIMIHLSGRNSHA